LNKKNLTIILGIAIPFFIGFFCYSLTPEQEKIDECVPELKGLMPEAPEEKWKMREIEIESTALRGKGKCSIYLPPDYENNRKKKYPVVYYLHGMGDNHKTWLDGEQEMDRMATLLIERGEIIPVILVAPDGGRGFWSNFFDGSVLYEDWVVQELKNYIEKNYRVLKGRKNTVIAGVSMGGYGALKIAMRHPELYGLVCAISPAIPPPLLPGEQSSWLTRIFGPPSDQAYYRQNHPYWLVRQDPAKFKNITFVFKCGTADNLFPTVSSFVSFMKLSGISCEFQTYTGMKHDVFFFRRSSVDCLRRISQYFSQK